MRTKIASAACLLCVMMATAVAAQTRPDFSGVWKPVEAPRPPAWPEPPPGAPPLPPMPPPTRVVSSTIAQSTTEIKIELRYVRAGTNEVLESSVHKLDGTESANQIGSSVRTSKVTWDGAALVLTSTVPMKGQSPWRITDVYRLEDGQLVIENTLEHFGGTFSGKRVYRKDESPAK